MRLAIEVFVLPFFCHALMRYAKIEEQIEVNCFAAVGLITETEETIEILERLSMTFTVNGKRQKSNFWCLILAVCTI